MNELITTHPAEIVADRVCRQCDAQLEVGSNFCCNCGTSCRRDLIERADRTTSTPVVHLKAERSPVVVVDEGTTAISSVLNSRLAVISIVALIGPLGLLALWFSPRFTNPTKIITTAIYALLTTVVPVVIIWYWLDYSMRPLVEIFGN